MTTTARAAKIRACQVTRTDAGFSVESPSGNSYRVTTLTRLDNMGSLYFERRCTCPARHGCVHVDAVNNYEMNEAIATGDYDGADILERVR